MKILQIPSISRAFTPVASPLAAVFCLLLLLTPSGGLAEVPKHPPMEHGQMNHDGHTMPAAEKHTGHDMSGEGHAEHTQMAEEKEHVHVHPSPEQVSPDAVGLEEQLGAVIPLDLTFFDEDGNPVRLEELITRPTVIAPIYYRCPNVCHYLQGDLARVLPQLKLKAGEEYQVLSVSFDEREKPELAKRSRHTYYAAMKNAYPDGAWRFLTGELDQILALTDSAGFRFQRVGHDFLHPVAFFVVTKEGKIVRYLHGTHVLPKDLTLALYEAQEGRIGTTIRKAVQFCFSFDPEQKTYVFNVLRVSATVILLTLGAFLAFLLLTGKKMKKDKQHE